MSSLFARAVARRGTTQQRSGDPLGFQQWVDYFNFNGQAYPFGPQFSYSRRPEEIVHNFEGYVDGVYRSNGVVFACIAARAQLFSEARFQFRRMKDGRPGDLFGTPALGPLEVPWTNGTTGDLLARAITDLDLSGNFFCYRDGQTIRRLRPDWMSVISASKTSESPNAPDAEVLGYVYHVDGPGGGEMIHLPREVVAHWAPTPDPRTRFLGMSWITPVIREILADGAAMSHKLAFFENGATPNLAVTLDPDINPDTAERFMQRFREDQEGATNAYRTLFLGGTAKVDVVGANMQQLDFKATQGHGETRICAAARVPPIIVGVSEGLDAATYSNYGQARRAFADGTMRPLWRSFCSAIAPIVQVPNGAELWYDSRDVAFLQEDQKDAADIQGVKAVTIHTLITAGYEPDSVIKAVEADDYSILTHTGMYSVQLVPPGTPGALGEGKGAVVAGEVSPAKAPKQIPAKTGRSAVDDVLEAVRAARN